MQSHRLAINQITTPRWTLAEAAEGYARQGVGGIGIWRDRLAECGLARARGLLRDLGLWVPSLCKAGDLAMLDARGPAAALDDCRQAIDEAASIGAATVVFVAGGIGAHADLRSARARVRDLLWQARETARAAGVSIGIEPFHPMHAAERSCINTLAQAHRLRDELGGAASVVLDVFHCWWDPELETYLAPPYLDAVSTVQLCDWRVPTRHPVTDRAMIGDGAADVAGMVRQLEARGYRGPYEIEIFSTEWWDRDPADVTRICAQRFAALSCS
ncbi:sugar phosphate isomerase/epimerase family protein [Bordetella petrii]|uniref:sugar phosphate isomerase/epimerase family protein n=1 Tax=Bordetella petrii TaxID=94624 RepID=UPI0037309E84